MAISLSSNKVLFNYVKCRPGIDPKTISAWITQVCNKEKKVLIGINYTFCSDEYLLQINNKYLGHNFYTDIITFDLSDDKNNIEADIYISLERVRDNSKQLGLHYLEELNRVIVHGLLHLCGYKDKTKSDIDRMRRKENFYLRLL